MKYYHLNPAREDRHGSVPSINSVDVDLDFSPRLVPEGGLVVPIVDLMEGLVENDQFWEDPVPLRIPIKEEHNGPARFLDLLTVHNFARAALVVSQPFREVLDRFSLPPHAVYELETYFESKGKKDTRNYFIYHFVFDNMYEDLDFSGDSLSFEKVALSSSGRLKSREPYPGSFNSYEEYRKAHYDIQFSSGILDFWEIVPREFSYPYDYDLVINKGNVIINEDLKAVIDVAEFTGCTISEVEHMVITMEGAETGGHREKNRRIIGSLVSTD